MKEKIKVALIGCGTITQKRHLPEYRADPNVEIVAVCDANLTLAQEVAYHFQVPQYYQDYRVMLNECSVDALSVCTPNHSHAQITIDCLKRGKHVLCEKPMSTSYRDAEAMVEAAKQNQVFLMIGHNQRFVPAYKKAKELIQSKRLGEVHHFHLRFAHAGPEEWSVEGKNSWFFDREQAFFGSMGDLGVHKIDLIRWLLEEEVTQIGCLSGVLAKKNTVLDDNAVFILKMAGGAIGTLGTSWTHKPWFSNELTVYCDKGTLRIDQELGSPGIVMHDENGVQETFDVGWSNISAAGQPYSGVIEHFIQGIRTGQGHEIDGDEALKTMRVLFAAHESVRHKQIINLPIN